MKKTVQNLTLSAMFMAIGLILPFFTGQIPQVGNMLLPMHIPVILCGLICGWKYGLAVGFVLPLFRYVLFGMPVLIPMGASMAFELAAYGLTAGLVYGASRFQCLLSLYRSLVIAMLAGRLVWGLARTALVAVTGEPFTWQMFMAGAFLNAIPGIVVQLILIPTLMVALNRTGLVHFKRQGREDGLVKGRVS